MGSVSDKIVEKTKTHILRSVIFSFEIRALCEIIWKNIVQHGRPQMTKRRMRLTCWTPKAKGTHSAYVILKDFPLQQ